MTTIRCARNYDAPALAALSGELGYPATRPQVVTRLAAIEASASAKVFVAEDAQGVVVGWLQVAQTPHLADGDLVEIVGLVVAERVRSHGIGAALLDAAETWARARGAAELRVRSRVERERAHRFYERAGFVRVKTQHALRKTLA